MSSTGLIVPSVFDTWVNATSFGLSLSRTSNTSWRRSPSSVIGMNSRSASFSCASSCHGTRLAWCSISVRTITSPRPMLLAAPRVRDEVDRLGRVAREHDLVGVGDADQPGRPSREPSVLRGRLLADGVDPAVDVGVVLAVVGVHRLEHDLRLLRGRGGVEIDERLPVDLLASIGNWRAGAGSIGSAGRRRSSRPTGAGVVGPGSGHVRHRPAAAASAPAGPPAPRRARPSRARSRAGSGRSPPPRAGARGPCHPGHDPAGGQDVHVVGRDVVEQPLVVGDQQHAHVRVELRVDALGDDAQRVDVEARVVSSRMAISGSSIAIWSISGRFFSPPEKPSFT